MAKDIVSVPDFSGGLNTFANPRNVEPNQLIEATNIDTSVPGTLGMVGGFEDYDNATTNNTSVTNCDVTQGGY